MPDTIANNGTAVPDMSRAAAKAIYPNGGRNRTAAGPTVPPGGLYMTQLWYGEDVP